MSEGTERQQAETAQGAPDADPDVLMQQLEAAQAKAEEHWNQFLRARAELQNLQKRAEREVENAHKYGLERFVAELLPVRDSLELGLLAVEEAADADKLKEGIELTLKLLTTALTKFGINEINPLGESFNPELHEAMSVQERTDVDPNTVVGVLQKGYVLNDRLIRPAMVMVSKAPADGGQVDTRA